MPLLLGSSPELSRERRTVQQQKGFSTTRKKQQGWLIATIQRFAMPGMDRQDLQFATREITIGVLPPAVWIRAFTR